MKRNYFVKKYLSNWIICYALVTQTKFINMVYVFQFFHEKGNTHNILYPRGEIMSNNLNIVNDWQNS